MDKGAERGKMNKLIWYILGTTQARINYLAVCIGEQITKFLWKKGYVAIYANGKRVWAKKKE